MICLTKFNNQSYFIMKKLSLFLCVLLGLSVAFTSCSKDDNEGSTPSDTKNFGVPSDSEAGQMPTITANNVVIPNFSTPYVEEGTNGNVGNISFTGIKGIDGDFLALAGTGSKSQNIWMSIDGKPKSIDIVNADEITRADTKKGLADIVFLIDNSGSMSEEANALAAQVLAWSQKLAQVVDCKFGCVGYGDNSYGIDGGMDLADIEQLNAFFNRNGSSGTSRTYGFYGERAQELQTLCLSTTGGYYNGSYQECGALALHFADEQFSFRSGANRIYINFTDEPNQPNNYKQWSVETLNEKSTLYNWNMSKGTVHSVYSATDVASYEEGGYYYRYNQSSPYTYYEKPWAMSEYTGGITLKTDPYFTEFKMDDLEVTAAIVSSYILRFNITADLREGTHTIIIIIKDKNGSEASKTFEDVVFSLK